MSPFIVFFLLSGKTENVVCVPSRCAICWNPFKFADVLSEKYLGEAKIKSITNGKSWQPLPIKFEQFVNWTRRNKLQKLEDALVRQMLTAADRADQADRADRADWADKDDQPDQADWLNWMNWMNLMYWMNWSYEMNWMNWTNWWIGWIEWIG